MQVERKYEQWKAITESDFVTLFIKTWFTFIAVLRELNPDVDVFTEDGMPRGDKPFLNAYKEGIMPIVQKNINTDDFALELFVMYPISMRKVIDVFPQYFFQTFFQINREFSYEEKTIDLDKGGNLKERYQANLHIVDKHILKFYLSALEQFETTKIPNEFDVLKNSGTDYAEGVSDVGVIKTKQLTNSGVNTDGIESYFTHETCIENKSTLVVNNDVVFASMGVGSLGKVSLFSYDGDKPFVTDSK